MHDLIVFIHTVKTSQDSTYKQIKSLNELTNVLDNKQKSTVFLYIRHQKLLNKKSENKAINK